MLQATSEWIVDGEFIVSATKTSKTVLVVEDNSIQREGLASVLRNEGYRVLAAADGEEALKYLRGDPTPDLLLLDMMMPQPDGWQYLGQLRRDPGMASVPIIITTGLGIASREWAISLGAAGLLCKPINFDELRRELERFR